MGKLALCGILIGLLFVGWIAYRIWPRTIYTLVPAENGKWKIEVETRDWKGSAKGIGPPMTYDEALWWVKSEGEKTRKEIGAP